MNEELFKKLISYFQKNNYKSNPCNGSNSRNKIIFYNFEEGLEIHLAPSDKFSYPDHKYVNRISYICVTFCHFMMRATFYWDYINGEYSYTFSLSDKDIKIMEDIKLFGLSNTERFIYESNASK